MTLEYENPLGIADELDKRGVVCLENATPRDWLTKARAEVQELLRKHGEVDHFIRSPYGAEHTSAESFIASSKVRDLLEDVVRSRFPEEDAELEFTGSALRVIAGPRGEGDAYWFHYDASVVTMVVPICMPDTGRGTSGELVGFFNKRPFRRFVLVNIVDKVIGQSGFYRRRILRRLERNDDLQIVDMTPGNVYLFWGYRSLHGNMPCESGAVRATLLLHFGYPHSSSALDRAKRVQRLMRRAKAGGGATAEVTAGTY